MYDISSSSCVNEKKFAFSNRGHHYIFIIIDVLSKYTSVISLKNKDGSWDNSKEQEILKKFTDHYGKKIL